MNNSIRLDSLGTISDNRLVRQLESLRGKERKLLAAVLRHLLEMERRKLYLPRGYSSLFEFCTQHLKYSRSAAGRRIAAARTIGKFSSLEGYILSGEINLYSLSLISGILTGENFKEIVQGIRNRPTREVEAFAAAYRPARVLKDRVKPVCVMVPAAPGGKGPGPGWISSTPGAGSTPGSGSTPGAGSAGSTPGAGSAGSTPGAGSGGSPGLSSTRAVSNTFEKVVISRKFKFEFAVNSEFKEKFDRMKALLSSSYPRGISFESLFMLLMDEYIERHSPEGRAARREKRQASRTNGQASGGSESRGNRSGKDRGSGDDRSRNGNESGNGTGTGKQRTRSIPAKVRDKVFLRDKGRCTFKGSDGKRCDSKWNLQIDHIVPFALGGDNSPGNLRLLCGKHNRLEAERAFGSQHMKRFKKRE